MLGLIGKKIGMTQVFAEDGTLVPVTAIEAGPCPIVQVRTEERDGYRAVQVGFGRKKTRRSTKAALGHAARAGLEHAPLIVREFRLGASDVLAEDPHTAPPAEHEGQAEAAAEDGESGEGAADEQATSATGVGAGLRVGQVLTVEIFSEGDRVKVKGFTKGRGFQGVVKRHRFAGRPKSHGHPSTRAAGSLGAGTDPSRVIKGRKMSGQMGNEQRTNRSQVIAKIDPARNLVFVKGSVPGARNSWVLISKQ